MLQDNIRSPTHLRHENAVDQHSINILNCLVSASNIYMFILFLLLYQRKRNKSRHRLKISKVINSSLLYEDIEKYYLHHKSYPHCLLQLSKKEYDDLRNNSIHVKGIFMSNNQVQYSQISFVGSNIKMKKKKLNLDENDIDAHIVNVTRLKNRVFCITTNVSEVISLQSDTIIVPSVSRYNNVCMKYQWQMMMVLFYYFMLWYHNL